MSLPLSSVTCSTTITGPAGAAGPVGTTGTALVLPTSDPSLVPLILPRPPTPFPTFQKSYVNLYRLSNIVLTADVQTNVVFEHSFLDRGFSVNFTDGSITPSVTGTYALTWNIGPSDVGNFEVGITTGTSGTFIPGSVLFNPPNGTGQTSTSGYIIAPLTAGVPLFVTIFPNVNATIYGHVITGSIGISSAVITIRQVNTA